MNCVITANVVAHSEDADWIPDTSFLKMSLVFQIIWTQIFTPLKAILIQEEKLLHITTSRTSESSEFCIFLRTK